MLLSEILDPSHVRLIVGNVMKLGVDHIKIKSHN